MFEWSPDGLLRFSKVAIISTISFPVCSTCSDFFFNPVVSVYQDTWLTSWNFKGLCTPAWKIPWMEEPGRLQSMGSLRVGHDWAISLSLSRIGEGNGNPLQCSCLENTRDEGAWWAAVYGVTQSRTRLKWLSSSSSLLIWFYCQGK